MNPTVKSQWVDALRSGFYTQGRGCLKHTPPTFGKQKPVHNFCCLGVLCDLYQKQFPTKARWFLNKEGEWEFDTLNDTQHVMETKVGVLPKDVLKWAQLDNCNPSITTEDYTTSLAVFNDSLYDFKQVADLIEQHL
jgi:hypothetical protein